MFTGLVEEIGVVKAAPSGGLAIAAKKVLEGMKVGDSIALNGACLTIIGLDGVSFSVEVMPETLRRTNLGRLYPGERVNLERPVAAGGRFGGHFVQGHVDATGRLLSLSLEGEALVVRYEALPPLMRYIVEKGFIAVDGVSLTVVDCEAASFRASLVGYTRENTTLGTKRPGDIVNLEVDIIAKYLEKLGQGRAGITLEFLGEQGFLGKG